MLTLSLLAICSALLLNVNAQLICEDVSEACSSNPCDNAVCPLYFNAECVPNTCDRICKPNFFYRGRNVTNRCGGVTCDTKDCGTNRDCMEEIITQINCRPGRPCRLRLKVTCPLRPQPARPMTCDDINCKEGMMCRMRDRGIRPPVIRCVPADPTNAPPTTTRQTTTATSTRPTTLPITTVTTPITPRISTNPPTSSPTPQPTSCQDVSCNIGMECVEFPIDFIAGFFSGPTCINTIRLSCNDLSCQPNETCITQTIPVAAITVSSCALSSILPLLNTSAVCDASNCGDGDTGCILNMHPSIVTSGVCLRGFSLTVRYINYVLDQVSTASSPSPMTTTKTPFTPGVSTSSPSTSTSSPPTSQPVPSGCDNVTCGPSLVCVEFPEDIPTFGGATCVPPFALSCDSLSCPVGQECIIQAYRVPEGEISAATCRDRAFYEQLTPRTCDDLTFCEGDDVGCTESRLSLGTFAFCLENFSTPVRAARHLLMILNEQVSTVTPITPITSTFPQSTSPPVTSIFPTFTTTPTDSSLCSTDCASLGQQCVGIPVSGPNNETVTIGVCQPIIGLSCEDITCPDDQTCVLQSFVERDLDIAQCIPVSSLNFTQFRPTSCATVQCSQGSICIDLRIGDMQVTGTCLQTGCANNSSVCDLQAGNVCSQVPPEFGLGISSVCVPSFIQPQFGSQTCEMSGRTCPGTLVCQEAYFNNTLVSTACSVNPLPTSCNEALCGNGQECVLTTTAIGTLASCASNLDMTLPFILQLLELLGLIPTTSSPPTNPTETELMTTLSTIAPPITGTTETPCFLDCSSTGQVCLSLGNNAATCVPPPTCNAEFSAYCSQLSLVCQESNGQAFCAPPSNCSQVVCPGQLQCYELPPPTFGTNDTRAVCLPRAALTCEELSCNGTDRCLITDLPTRNVSSAQCASAQVFQSFLDIPTSCDTLECSEENVCIDLERSGFQVSGTCLTSGCGANRTCPVGSVCTSIPSDFGLQVESVCVPASVEPLFGSQTCAESGRLCSQPFLTCHEALVNGTLVGTACSPSSAVRVPSCQESLCREGEECILSKFEGFDPLQTCLPSVNLDQTVLFIELFLN